MRMPEPFTVSFAHSSIVKRGLLFSLLVQLERCLTSFVMDCEV